MGKDPDFIIIGAQKSGTTSLFRYLSTQPGIHMPKIKEAHFFDQHYQRGIEWYRSLFHTSQSETRCIAGEATPLYMFHPHAMERIREMMPSCKLIALLRNPVDRAYSHYYHEVQLNHEFRSFEEAIQGEEPGVSMELARMLREKQYFSTHYQRYSYLSRGRYYDQLAGVLNLFPREQLLVIQSEILFQQPQAVTRQVLRFLGVPGSSEIAFEKHHARRYPPITMETREKLSDYFSIYNEKLFALLGERYSWN